MTPFGRGWIFRIQGLKWAPGQLGPRMGLFERPKSLLEVFLGGNGFSGFRGPQGLRKGPGASEAKTFENLTASMKENDPFWEGVDFPDSGAQMGSWPARAPNGPF